MQEPSLRFGEGRGMKMNPGGDDGLSEQSQLVGGTNGRGVASCA